MASYSSAFDDAQGPGAGIDASLWQSLAGVNSAEGFCQSWLEFQCRGLASAASAILVLGGEDGRAVTAARWPENAPENDQLGQAARRGVELGEAQVLRPKNGQSGTGGVFITFPLRVGGQSRGSVAIFLEDSKQEGIEHTLKQLNWGVAWLEGLLARSDMAGAVSPQTNGHANGEATSFAEKASATQRSLLDVLATVFQHDRYQLAALAFVTELATRFKCDRVSLGAVKRNRMQIMSMSHTAKVGKTNLVRAIEAAMDEARDQRATVSFPQALGDRESRFSIARNHEELSRLHNSGSILSLPLVTEEGTVAVVTLERTDTKPFDESTRDYCEALWALAGPYLAAKRNESRALPLKVWDSADRELRKLIGPKHLGRKIAAATITFVLLFAIFATGDYRVSSRTVIEGAVQRVATSPFDGFIESANVRAGDTVEEGAVLCELDNRELVLEEARWSGQKEQLKKQWHQAMAEHDRAGVRIAKARMDQAVAQLELTSAQLARTKVEAPFDGVVVSGDLTESIGAPVRRGDPLFQIAPLDGYRVILEVDERDITEIEIAQQGHLVLSAFPSEKFPFKVKRITPVSTASEGRNFFRVEAELEAEPGKLRPGLEGIGKIEIEERNLVWIWTHNATNWLRLKLWKWLP